MTTTNIASFGLAALALSYCAPIASAQEDKPKPAPEALALETRWFRTDLDRLGFSTNNLIITVTEILPGEDLEAMKKTDEEQRCRDFLSFHSGVDWPTNSSLCIAFEFSGIRIKNTRQNLDRIENFLSKYTQTRRVEVEARFVEASRTALAESGWFDLSRPDAATLWNRLSSRKDVKIVSAPYAQTRDGEEVVLKGATDIMYAGEYGIKFSGKDPATVNEPINEYRDIGNSINVTPKVSDSGDFIELEVILDAADGEMDWQDYKVSLPSSDDDTTTTLLIRQPVFPDKSCNVKLTVAPGNIVVLGGECKLLDPESFTLVFLSSRLIKAKGLDKETPGDGSLVAYSSKTLSNGMETRTYWATTNAFNRISDAFNSIPGARDDYDDYYAARWRYVFADFGVAWPEGSSIFCERTSLRREEDSELIKVTNTPENLRLFESIWTHYGLDDTKNIEVDARFVEASRAALEEAGWFAFGKKDPIKLYQRLLRSPNAKVVSSHSVTVRNGEESVGKNLRELFHPTEFCASQSSCHTICKNGCLVTNAVIVTSASLPFMMHGIGTIFEVTPHCDFAGYIGLDLRIHQFGDPAWVDYGVMLPNSEERKFFARINKLPIFSVKNIEANVSLYNDETAVFGGMTDGTAKNADVFTLVFVTPRRITISGLHNRKP